MEFPLGFHINGVKKSDIGFGLISAPEGMVAAGVFTVNKAPAECVKYSKKIIKRNSHKAIIVNRGSANAATGPEGFRRMKKMVDKTARSIKAKPEEVLNASTGVIGEQIRYEEDFLDRLFSDGEAVNPKMFSEAIMTTDTCPKRVSRKYLCGEKEVRVFGAAKGSGMICPDMATMLAFILTDAAVEKRALKTALKKASSSTFNRLNIDGETSTNDSVFLCASGKAGNRKIKSYGRDFKEFCRQLESICLELTEKLAADGEGATKMINIVVKGAPDKKTAYKAVKAVSSSPLCKTAFYGASPNWGRIVSALGAAGISVSLENLSILFDGFPLLEKGCYRKEFEKKITKIMKGDKYRLEIDLHSGSCTDRGFTCDMSPEYVKINAHYLS